MGDGAITAWSLLRLALSCLMSARNEASPGNRDRWVNSGGVNYDDKTESIRGLWGHPTSARRGVRDVAVYSDRHSPSPTVHLPGSATGINAQSNAELRLSCAPLRARCRTRLGLAIPTIHGAFTRAGNKSAGARRTALVFRVARQQTAAGYHRRGRLAGKQTA